MMTIYDLTQITTLVVNYRTLDHTSRCVESFRKIYPQVHILLIDNGSHDSSTVYIQEIARWEANITAILNKCNINHGPAIHQGLLYTSSPFVLMLDSDCQVMKSGFLEQMLSIFQNKNIYAVGERIFLNRLGYEVQIAKQAFTTYIQPYCMLIDREKYLHLKPFIHHGSPGIYNMHHANQYGFQLYDFPISQYIQHTGCGTCSRYGYNLGLRHKFENVLQSILNSVSKYF